MLRLLQSIFDSILPRPERSVRIDSYTIEQLQLSPLEQTLHDFVVTSLLSYRDRATEDLIRALKYDRNTHAARILAQVLEEYLAEFLSDETLFSSRTIVLTSVPLHDKRERERGYNQIDVVLDALSPVFLTTNHVRRAPLLQRRRNTTPQTKLTRAERLTNMRNAFSLVDATEIDHTHVILVDDVVTTGATLAEAGKPFEAAGARVTRLSLARA